MIDRMCLLYFAIYFYMAFVVDFIRIYSGPLPYEICWIYKFAKSWAAHGAMIVLMTMTTARVSNFNIFFRGGRNVLFSSIC